MLTVHTSELLPKTCHSSRALGATDLDASTSIAALHPWSPELGTPRAFELVSHHLTEEDKGILDYLGKHRGAEMLPEVKDRFYTRLSWAGKVHEALSQKDEALRGSRPPSSEVSR